MHIAKWKLCAAGCDTVYLIRLNRVSYVFTVLPIWMHVTTIVHQELQSHVHLCSVLIQFNPPFTVRMVVMVCSHRVVLCKNSKNWENIISVMLFHTLSHYLQSNKGSEKVNLINYIMTWLMETSETVLVITESHRLFFKAKVIEGFSDFGFLKRRIHIWP